MFLLHLPVEHFQYLDLAIHVYCYSEGMPPDLLNHIESALLASSRILYVITCMKGFRYHGRFVRVGQVSCQMNSGGGNFTMTVYKRTTQKLWNPWHTIHPCFHFALWMVQMPRKLRKLYDEYIRQLQAHLVGNAPVSFYALLEKRYRDPCCSYTAGSNPVTKAQKQAAFKYNMRTVDIAIANSYLDMAYDGDGIEHELKRRKPKESSSLVYGEIRPDGQKHILTVVGLNEHDVGSRSGRFVLYAAMTTEVKWCLGIEIVKARANVGDRALESIGKESKVTVRAALLSGDTLDESSFWARFATVLFCNNVKFAPPDNLKLHNRIQDA
ncbi:hypothetical protein AaE_012924 [Aphanomyces astaci]|uniref:Histone-lysine N-methyltransferase, H3 lysine-79 specific n=1 Tax=Aphanomyces astaci TaxID=112090 RepID=A0A6A4ZE25_APHAT|nr:hypothetical protein AaE_012924 [Aphanomyces astaci]